MASSYSYNCDHFRLFALSKKNKTKIKLEIIAPILTTGSVPNTVSYLENNLPTVLKNKCFNEESLPFHKEVIKTEIGHLFEHMLLEYLCLEKRSLGHKKVAYNGKTSWNWKKDKKGVFHIVIDAGLNEDKVLNEALSKSTSLFTDFLSNINYGLISSAGNLSDYPLQTEALS